MNLTAERLEAMCEAEGELLAFVDAELTKRVRESLTKQFIEELPLSMLSLFCVIMEGTHFVKAETVVAELKTVGVDVTEAVIEPYLQKWREQPLPMNGILGAMK